MNTPHRARDNRNTTHGGGKRKNRSARREQRHLEAVERHNARSERTNEQQLALLTAGGHSHCAEAKRLAAA